MSEQEELIGLGHEAKLFASSNLGKYLKERSLIEIEDALYALESADPEDIKTIKHNQNIIMVYRQFNQWIDDAIVAGELSYSEYLSEDE